MKKDENCPICAGRYWAIRESEKVCEGHQDWFVTRCREPHCGVIGFSDLVGFCVKHGNQIHVTSNFMPPMSPAAKKHDPNAYLRRVGQQGYSLRGL